MSKMREKQKQMLGPEESPLVTLVLPLYDYFMSP